MSSGQLRFQVFLSYSRRDSDTVKKVVDHLRSSGLEIWIDTTGLEPGTSHWGNAIQEAINQSFAVVWVASPNGKASPYIKDEVDTAIGQGIAVIPAWIEGTNWHESAWLGAGQMQYVDCRESKFEEGIAQLLAKLQREKNVRVPAHQVISQQINEIPKGFLSVVIDSERQVVMRCDAYQNLEHLLRDLYVYIKDEYPPYTYGQTWILMQRNVGNGVARVVATWQLFESLDKAIPLNEIELGWSHDVSLDDMGLTSGTQWMIQIPTKQDIRGIASYDSIVIDAITQDAKLLKLLRDEFSPRSWYHVEPNLYPNQILISTDFWFQNWKDALIQEDQPISRRLQEMCQRIVQDN